MSQYIPSEGEQLFAPTSGDWDAYFEFSPEGYIKDNETLDPDEHVAYDAALKLRSGTYEA